MGKILELVAALVAIVFDALAAYDETPEGHQALEALLLAVEQEGFDIPGWEPSGDEIDLKTAASGVVERLAQEWQERHPELIAKEKGRR